MKYLGMRLDRRFHNPPIKSLVLKQSVVINGRDSSVSIEGAFWNAFRAIAVAQNISVNALVSKIDSEREAANLSSAMLSSTIASQRTRVLINARTPERHAP